MIVLLAGMPRSGSTFSFNVVRETIRSRGTLYQEASGDVLGAVRRSGGTDHVLIKTHSLDQPSIELARAGAMRIIITVRRVEDAMASWFDAFETVPEQTAIQIMRDWLGLYRQIASKSLIVPYDDIDHHPRWAAWRMARAIRPAISPLEAIAIAQRFSKTKVKRKADLLEAKGPGVTDLGFSHFDDETFFHRRHVAEIVSRPAEHRLSEAKLGRVRDALAEDISAAGLASLGKRSLGPLKHFTRR